MIKAKEHKLKPRSLMFVKKLFFFISHVVFINDLWTFHPFVNLRFNLEKVCRFHCEIDKLILLYLDLLLLKFYQKNQSE